jgi:Secretion system C-terminal sorting domain
MKNLLSTLLFAFGICAMAQAQATFMISPSPASATGAVDQGDVPVDAHIVNLTAATLPLKWERQVINLTSGCETAVCDPNVCWARHISFRNFDLDPNATGDMLVHFYNNGAPCAGIVHVKVSNRDFPQDSIVGVYLFNQSSSAKDLPAANVKLFPNPVTEYFSLENAENVATIRVFSLDGREVARFENANQNVYYLRQPAGNYVIALEDKNGQAFQALEISIK